MATVLVADGDRNLRGVVKFALVSAGYEVTESADVQDAIDKSVKDQPDLILWGLTIADSDMADAMKLLRDDPATSNIPVVILQEHEGVQGLQASGQDFLSKPFTAGQLESKIRSAISESKLTTSIAQQGANGTAAIAPPQDSTPPTRIDIPKSGMPSQPSSLGVKTKPKRITTLDARPSSGISLSRFLPSTKLAVAAMLLLFGLIVLLAPMAYPIRSTIFGETDFDLGNRLPPAGKPNDGEEHLKLDPWLECIADSLGGLRERVRKGNLDPLVENKAADILPVDIECENISD